MRLANKWQYAIVAAVSAVVFAWYQAAPSFADPDSYYHASITMQMLQHGIVREFPWLPFTTLAQAFADQHFLYHVLLMPWVWLCGPVVGLKAFQAISAVILMLVLFHILKRWKLPYALLAMPFLATCYPFLIRINLAKASTVAIILLLLILVCLWEKRWGWAGAITIIYSLAHGGFLLAVVVASALWLAETCILITNQRKVVFANATGVVATVVGCVLGVVANPYFPNNIPFLWAQFFQIGVVNYQHVIQVGAEWYPFSIPDLLSYLSILAIVVLVALAMLVAEHKQQPLDKVGVSLLALSGLFLVLTIRSRRFIEYLVPILWLFAMYIVLPRVRHWWQQWHIYLGKWWIAFIVYLGFSGVFVLITVTVNTTSLMYEERPVAAWQPVGAFLEHHIPAGELIFNGMWHHFPQLMYISPSHAYMVGLDSTFLYLASPEHYKQWNELSEGKSKLDSATAIRKQFNANYVFIDTKEEHTKLLYAYLLRDPNVQTIYQDDNFIIFAL